MTDNNENQINSRKNKPVKKKLLFTFRHAPYGSSIARDGLDALLAASAYGQDLSVLFMGDGVFQLLTDQQSSDISAKSLSATLPALPIYDIDQIYVQESALIERGLQNQTLVLDAQVLNDQAVRALMLKQEGVLSF